MPYYGIRKLGKRFVVVNFERLFVVVMQGELRRFSLRSLPSLRWEHLRKHME